MSFQTEGKDISYLMYALDNLRKLYSLQFWLFIVLLVLFPDHFLASSPWARSRGSSN